MRVMFQTLLVVALLLLTMPTYADEELEQAERIALLEEQLASMQALALSEQKTRYDELRKTLTELINKHGETYRSTRQERLSTSYQQQSTTLAQSLSVTSNAFGINLKDQVIRIATEAVLGSLPEDLRERSQAETFVETYLNNTLTQSVLEQFGVAAFVNSFVNRTMAFFGVSSSRTGVREKVVKSINDNLPTKLQSDLKDLFELYEKLSNAIDEYNDELAAFIIIHQAHEVRLREMRTSVNDVFGEPQPDQFYDPMFVFNYLEKDESLTLIELKEQNRIFERIKDDLSEVNSIRRDYEVLIAEKRDSLVSLLTAYSTILSDEDLNIQLDDEAAFETFIADINSSISLYQNEKLLTREGISCNGLIIQDTLLEVL